MPVLTLTVFSLVGLGVFAALSAALYSSLPRSFLESAERGGGQDTNIALLRRFAHFLQPPQLSPHRGAKSPRGA